MPVDYQCRDCGLQFSVGSLKLPRQSEFHATYLVCRSCGTWHLALYSLRGRRGDRLLAQPHPQIKRPKVSHTPMIPAETWVAVEPARSPYRRPAEVMPPLRSWLGIRARFSTLTCGHCHERGGLTAGVRGNSCPRCKKATLAEWLSYVK